jgi:holliday junction DNA helicase RuvA
MIEFLRGKLAQKQATRLWVDVQGVGYGIDVTLRASEQAGSIGDTITLTTWLHVKEELLELYGFADELEKQVFLKLISVSGIGPRMALRMLSTSTPQRLAELVLHGDVKGLSAIKGIGKKTAEVLIASLRNAFSKMDLAPAQSGSSPTSPENDAMRDAVLALISLGVKDTAAQLAVQQAVKKIGDKADTSRLIAQALQEV